MKQRHFLRTELIVVVLSLILLGVSSRCSEQEQARIGGVPSKYRALYYELERSLDEFSSTLKETGEHNVVFSADLMPADSHRQEVLLKPKTIAGVRLYLDRLQQLGSQAVKITISYPILSRDDRHREDYLAFYREVVREVRKRGMKVFIMTVVLVTDPTAGVEKHQALADLTWEEYAEGRRETARTIAKELKPDYLTITNEATTQTIATGLLELNEPVKHRELVEYILEGLEDVREGVRVGAGVGTWDDPAFVREFASLKRIDYIDLHIYPLQLGYGDRTLEMIHMAQKAGKPVVVGETWLYKAGEAELKKHIAPWGPILARNTFSFWAPLDSRFVNVMGRLARSEGIELLNFFWSKYFFDYVDWHESLEKRRSEELLKMADQAAAKAIFRGKVSPVGQSYSGLMH